MNWFLLKMQIKYAVERWRLMFCYRLLYWAVYAAPKTENGKRVVDMIRAGLKYDSIVHDPLPDDARTLN